MHPEKDNKKEEARAAKIAQEIYTANKEALEQMAINEITFGYSKATVIKKPDGGTTIIVHFPQFCD